MTLRRFSGISVAAALLIGLPGISASAETGDPPLDVPEATMAAALQCHDAPTPVAGREPVLLIHGTAQDGPGAWDWNYVPALNNEGINACTVTLPDHALTDIQTSTEYAVHAVRTMTDHYGSKVDVLGFSQGALVGRAAIKYWSDVRDSVDDMVALGAPYHGTAFANTLCVAGSCVPAMWQMKLEHPLLGAGSNFISALNAGDETPGAVSYTSISTRTDEASIPQLPTSVSWQNGGATNIAIQSVCPLRVVDHMQLTYDAVAYALVLDAFTHTGTSSVSRSGAGSQCSGALITPMPGIDLVTASAIEAATYAAGAPLEAGIGYPTVSAEPSLRW
ncbi:alpha/beta fold hydrolase [Kitasatospora sp. NPDC048540]|uniref:alpha/beta fold hydrolase n=1 Tax=unclassified Kitasatospora TaxID=2633591 RepID=UPI0009EC20C6|nr:alpha/beta fold hydrolase [Kitasatospora sp. MBT63]